MGRERHPPLPLRLQSQKTSLRISLQCARVESFSRFYNLSEESNMAAMISRFERQDRAIFPCQQPACGV